MSETPKCMKRKDVSDRAFRLCYLDAGHEGLCDFDDSPNWPVMRGDEPFKAEWDAWTAAQDAGAGSPSEGVGYLVADATFSLRQENTRLADELAALRAERATLDGWTAMTDRPKCTNCGEVRDAHIRSEGHGLVETKWWCHGEGLDQFTTKPPAVPEAPTATPEDMPIEEALALINYAPILDEDYDPPHPDSLALFELRRAVLAIADQMDGNTLYNESELRETARRLRSLSDSAPTTEEGTQ